MGGGVGTAASTFACGCGSGSCSTTDESRMRSARASSIEGGREPNRFNLLASAIGRLPYPIDERLNERVGVLLERRVTCLGYGKPFVLRLPVCRSIWQISRQHFVARFLDVSARRFGFRFRTDVVEREDEFPRRNACFHKAMEHPDRGLQVIEPCSGRLDNKVRPLGDLRGS